MNTDTQRAQLIDLKQKPLNAWYQSYERKDQKNFRTGLAGVLLHEISKKRYLKIPLLVSSNTRSNYNLSQGMHDALT